MDFIFIFLAVYFSDVLTLLCRFLRLFLALGEPGRAPLMWLVKRGVGAACRLFCLRIHLLAEGPELVP